MMFRVSASSKSPMLGGDVDDQITQAKAHHVVSNDGSARGLSGFNDGASRKQ